MGSVVISDVVSDTARFPYTMLGGAHPASPVESAYRSPSSSHPTPPTSLSSGTPTGGGARDSRAARVVSSSYAPPHPSPFTPPASTSSHPAADGAAIRPPFPSQPPILHPHPPPATTAYMGKTPPDESPVAYLSPSPAAHPTPSASGPGPGPDARSSAPATSRRITVRSLAHIQQLARDDVIQTRSPPSVGRSRRHPHEVGPRFEISEMPVADVIEMVAGLLTKITTTNDRQHEHLHRHIPPPESATGLSPQTSSVLAFHGKNVPSITILSYLSRIHKYCPTTYEVFLSLLVYFDRMTERVNSTPVDPPRTDSPYGRRSSHGRHDSRGSELGARRRSNLPDRRSTSRPTSVSSSSDDPSGPFIVPDPSPRPDASLDMSHFFVVDSFNIHRLVIAGVTCASKFFSDVFYTNSRYAKVRAIAWRRVPMP